MCQYKQEGQRAYVGLSVWGGGEGLAAALGDVGRWRGRTPETERVQGCPDRETSVSGVVLASLERY